MTQSDSNVSRQRSRFFRIGAVCVAIALVAIGATARLAAQGPQTGVVAGRNVNMVSGTGWPDGDPFLQRQNEPSVAASTRNPLHLLGGSNDYRTVDLPGLPNGGETGDAWLGVFKSFDGGQRWRSTLLPGYPQDKSAAGLASPLKGYEAGADPVVRAGTNGLFYYAGIVFNRGTNAPSRVFVARFIDNNNKENGDPVAYLGATAIASNSGQGGAFIDKPWIAVDVPRAGARTCRIVTPGQNGNALTQTIPAGMVYLTYSVITGTGTTLQSAVMFTSSSDCGVTWSRPVQISDPAARVNQGSTIAIDPASGAVFVTWRQFGLNGQSDAITVARASAGGKGFGALRVLRKIAANHTEHEVEGWLKRERDEDAPDGKEHESGSAKENRERQSRGDKSEKVDKDDREQGSVPGQGNAWGRGNASVSTASTIQGTFDQPTANDQFRTNAYPTMTVDAQGRVYVAWTERGRAGFNADQARIVISTSRDGVTWTPPAVVEDPVNTYNAAQKLPGHQLMPTLAFAGGKLVLAFYDLREDISDTFSKWVDDGTSAAQTNRRHTIDIRATMADPADAPVFEPSVRVSQYLETVRPYSGVVQQLQFNVPNLPLFKMGTAPFMGDYIDITPAPAFVQNGRGQWVHNTTPTSAPVFHLVWTDNRDVRPPKDGAWTKYTPPKSPFTGQQCDPGFTASRNQNIYTSRLTRGLLTGSPGNSKQLSPTVPRGFVVFAQNGTAFVKTFRFTVAGQPVGGRASFTQFLSDPLVTSVDVNVAPRSSVSRTVYVTSTDPRASVVINVTEVDAPQGAPVGGGLSGAVVLNPDISNPDISNPDISNPNISNPNISNAEVYNPNISNPNISNPNISNPDISNPNISNPDISNVLILNPDISNPNISNPNISNPDISNPDISNPNISNPDISNGALTDVTWTITNTGNTTGTFNVDLFAKNATLPGGIKTQLIVYKQYKTPTSDGCALMVQTDNVLVANIIDPVFKPSTDPVTKPDPGNPNISNATLWLEPGASAKITLRVVDTQPNDPVVFNPATQVTPTVTSTAYNVEGLASPNTPPPTPPADGAAPPNTQPATTNVPVLSFGGPIGNTQIGQPIPSFSVVASGQPSGVEIPVTVAIATGGSLDGTTTLMTVGGVATFTDIAVDHAVDGLVLVASSSPANALPVYSNAFAITRKPTAVTMTCPASVTYSGVAQTPCTAAVTSADGLNLALPVTYANNVNAGTATASASFAGDATHAPSAGSANFSVAPAASSVTVTCPASVPYNGSAQTPCTATVAGTGTGITQAVTWTYASNVGAGTATASAAYAGDANHAGSTGSASFIITAAISTVTVTCPASVAYSGSALTPCTAAVTSPDGLSLALTVTYTDNVNAGTATASASFAGDANHAASAGSASFSIAPAASSVTVTCPASFAYTGLPIAPCSASVTGPGGLNLPLAVTYANNVDAGTAIASAQYAGDANHAGSSASVPFTVTPAASAVTVTCPASVPYSGAALTPCSASVTGPGGLNQALGVTYANNVNAGTATASASFAGDANHAGSTGSATFTIAPAGPTDSFWHADGTGTDTVSGYTATLMGGAKYAQGLVGQAFSFSNNVAGSNQYVLIGDQPGLRYTNALTIAAWINPASDGLTTMGAEGGIIVNKEDSYEVARFSDGTIRFAFMNQAPGWAWVSSGAVAPLNTWTHVAVTYDNGVVNTYINGALVNTYVGSGSIAVNADQLRIGGRQYSDWVGGGSYRQNFDGLIDEVGLYNRALGAGEIQALAGVKVLSAAAGGSGGGAYGPLSCPAGTFGSGFRVATNDTPVNNSFGGISYALTSGALLCSDGSATPKFGGGTTPNTDLACPAGFAMVGMYGTTDGGANFGNPVVSSVGARCQPIGGGGIFQTATRPGGGPSFGTIDCPAGFVVTGVQGGGGAVVDRIQLVCSKQ